MNWPTVVLTFPNTTIGTERLPSCDSPSPYRILHRVTGEAGGAVHMSLHAGRSCTCLSKHWLRQNAKSSSRHQAPGPSLHPSVQGVQNRLLPRTRSWVRCG